MNQERHRRKKRGVALIVVLSAISILTAVVANMLEETSSSYAVAVAQRDRMRAEYMAKSSLNLTRLLVANEPQVRRIVAPMYQMMVGKKPPQLPIWAYADMLLSPFCRFDQAKEISGDSGFDLGNAEGLGELPGTCEIQAVAENSKLNISDPLVKDGERARMNVALQVYAMTGGYQIQSPFDPLFSERDAQGGFTSRLDVVTSLIDWWDRDVERTTFDPGVPSVSSGGAEDDIYARYDDPYQIKNAPFDTLQEARLVRGIDDDFWSTFIEPDPGDPSTRTVTIYGSGLVNPNEAPPEALLARFCSLAGEVSLCVDPLEQAKFIQLLGTIRALAPIPLFTNGGDFIRFLEGKESKGSLYGILKGMLGPEHPLLFRPVPIEDKTKRRQLTGLFIASARIIAVNAVGHVGRAKVKMTTVMNFHERWSPPPPNAGTMPKLGIFHYYRID